MAVKAKAEITISDILDGTDGTDGYSIIPMNRAPTYNTAYEYAWWKKVSVPGYTEQWAAINYADFKIGDIAIFSGTILDRNNAGVQMLLRVIDVGMDGLNVIRGSSICLLESGEDVQAALSNMIIGSRNYIKDSDVTYELTNTTSYKTFNMLTTDSLNFNDFVTNPFTLSFYVKTPGTHKSIGSGTVNGRFGMHCIVKYEKTDGTITNDYPFSLLLPFGKDERVFITQSFTKPSDAVSISRVLFTVQLTEAPADDNDETWIFSRPKFEKGNKATDWTPAPEDVQEGIDNAQGTADKAEGDASNALNQVVDAKATLSLLQSSIETLVTDANGASMMTQTSTGWTFNMGGFESALDKATNDITAIYGDISAVTDIANAADQLAKDIANKTAYINMSTDEDGAPCIELGKTDNEFKLRITNTSIDFMQGSQKIAYITNQSLYIRSSVVTDEMQIGEGTGFIWKKRSNGNMGLRSIG